MARKRYGEDDILRLLRKVEVHCSSGIDVVSACRKAGIPDKTYLGQKTSTILGDIHGDRLDNFAILAQQASRVARPNQLEKGKSSQLQGSEHVKRKANIGYAPKQGRWR